MNQLVVDVSHHNGVINWELVKATGAHAIIRCGYGDNIASQDDKQWSRNISEVERLGIPHGVYFYSYAKSVAEIDSEIAHCLRLIEGHTLQYPVYFDAEEPGTQANSCECANAFCAAMEAAGYWAGVYASDSWFKAYMGGLGNYTKWVARYRKYEPETACDMWQYTSTGALDGVPAAAGGVDLSNCYRDLPAEIGGQDTKEKEIRKMNWFAFPHGGATFVYMDGRVILPPTPEDWEQLQAVYRDAMGKEIPKADFSEGFEESIIKALGV